MHQGFYQACDCPPESPFANAIHAINRGPVWHAPRGDSPAKLTPTIQPFRHDQHIVLGVCGHWWQEASLDQGVNEDCPVPACRRPPSHVLAATVRHECNVLFLVKHPMACGL